MADLQPILLIEDSHMDAELTKETLREQHVANEIVIAADGVQALDILFGKGNSRRYPVMIPAAVFLDLKIPKIDGLTLLRIIKSDPILTTVPVIVLTGSRQERDAFESQRWGVQAYLDKPLQSDQLGKIMPVVRLQSAVIENAPIR